jgi:hypothetical protein
MFPLDIKTSKLSVLPISYLPATIGISRLWVLEIPSLMKRASFLFIGLRFFTTKSDTTTLNREHFM